jgi:hypothetical protein
MEMKIWSKIFVGGILLLLATFTVNAVDHFLYVYPTPETQSAFLKTYTATPVIDRFKAMQSSRWQGSADAAAGRKFVSRHKEEEHYFVIETGLEPLLIGAMKEDISDKLKQQGARIISQTNSPAGFEVRYELGQSRGIIALDPAQGVDVRMIMGHVPMPTKTEAIMLRVRIAETWSKSAPESRSDSPILGNPTNTAKIN